MACEENNKYSNIEHVRTNMLWMDIKIVDPEMEALMKQINEEQTKLKEALREKLYLMKYDTDVVQKENEQLKEWLRFKGIEFERNDYLAINAINDIVIKEEPIDNTTKANEHYEEKFNAQTSEEFSRIDTRNNKTAQGIMNVKQETNKLKSCQKKINDKKTKDHKENKDNPLKKKNQNMNRKLDVCDVNNQNKNEESAIATRTRRSKQVNVSVENVWLNEKKSKRGMKRRKLVKNYRTTNKRKKNNKEEVQNKEDIESADQP